MSIHQPKSPSLIRLRRTRRRTPHISLGAALGLLLALYVAVRTWPVQSIALLVLLIAAGIVAAVRPARLRGLFRRVDKVASRLPRTAIPRQRTAQAFHRLSPARFEQAIAELAARDPHTVSATVVGGTGDGGMDVRVQRTDGAAVLIQCKRYRRGNNVPARDIRDTNGAYRDLHHCNRAVIVTTSDFTRDAYATNLGLPQQLRLVNGEALEAWACGGPSPLN